MDEVKEAADKAQKNAEDEAKAKDKLKEHMSKQSAKIETLENQISRLNGEFSNLEKYKNFIEKVKENYHNLIQEMKQAAKKKVVFNIILSFPLLLFYLTSLI